MADGRPVPRLIRMLSGAGGTSARSAGFWSRLIPQEKILPLFYGGKYSRPPIH